MVVRLLTGGYLTTRKILSGLSILYALRVSKGAIRPANGGARGCTTCCVNEYDATRIYTAVDSVRRQMFLRVRQ